ncbi:hypothetical protein [Geomonas oryzae]|uniref:hypothetical protein n=1 Tax=Geomonas oryzae TaxID=2364273 RepID=UPI00100B83DA|nr:hypothetical protein [Geomonas oryzae]
MPLLAEYALTPGIFVEDSFPEATRDEIIYNSFALLREVFINEGLVRNLCSGAWQGLFRDGSTNWHPRGKELLRKLIEQNRLVLAPQCLTSIPSTEKEWCEEALASHQQTALCGIVTTDDVATNYPRTHQQVSAISKMPSAPWWSKRSCSVTVERNITCYLDHLRPLLMSANLLSFIDPYVDPSECNYRDFIQLIQAATSRRPLPLIQIHRRKGLDGTNWQAVFETAFGSIVKATGVRIDIFLWDEMHDRYLLSDIIGISMPYGFDTTARTDHLGRTTWNRMSRTVRDNVLKDFDEAAHFKRFRGQDHFVIQPL